MRLSEASPVTGSLVFHILQGAARSTSGQNAQGSANQTQVIRVGAILVLLLIAPAHAQTVAVPPGFDPHLITDVYATALAFMAPRTLEPVAVSQLTIWGLRGLAALDPDLTAGLRDGKLRVASRDRELAALPPPAEGDVNGWAGAATDLALAAAGTSVPVRRAGTQGVVQSFFDELFNHLDPYSRYVPPGDAGEDRERRVGSGGRGTASRPARPGHRGGGGDRRRSGRARRNPARRHDRIGGWPIDQGQGPCHRDELDRRAGRDPAHARLAWPRRAPALGGAGTRRGAARDRLRRSAPARRW